MPKTVTVDLDEPVLEALDRAAEQRSRTRADIIAEAVRDYLETQRWQVEKIKAGIAAADRGDFVSEKEISQLFKYAQELQDKDGYAWGLKGVPRTDKSLEELEIAKIVLRDVSIATLTKSERPDLSVELVGRRIGIEVTELVDREMREQHAKRRAAERRKGLSPTDAAKAEDAAFRKAREADEAARISGRDRRRAFESVYLENYPTPGHISRHDFADWDPNTLAQAIEERIACKEKKVTENAAKYNEIWLAIFTDEQAITEDAALSAKQKIKNNRKLIKRVFVVLGYIYGDYPVIEI